MTSSLASAHLVAASATDMSAGRAGAIAAGLLALVGIVLGVRALRRSSAGPASAPSVGLALGLVAIVTGGVVVATSDGSVGTGNGLGGAYVAIVAGLIALTVNTLARSRTQRRA